MAAYWELKKKNLVSHVRRAVFFGLPFDNFSNSNHFAHGVCPRKTLREGISETNGSSLTAPYVVIHAKNQQSASVSV